MIDLRQAREANIIRTREGLKTGSGKNEMGLTLIYILVGDLHRLFVCLFVCLFGCLFVCLFVCLFSFLSVFLFVCFNVSFCFVLFFGWGEGLFFHLCFSLGGGGVMV